MHACTCIYIYIYVFEKWNLHDSTPCFPLLTWRKRTEDYSHWTAYSLRLYLWQQLTLDGLTLYNILLMFISCTELKTCLACTHKHTHKHTHNTHTLLWQYMWAQLINSRSSNDNRVPSTVSVGYHLVQLVSYFILSRLLWCPSNVLPHLNLLNGLICIRVGHVAMFLIFFWVQLGPSGIFSCGLLEV